MSTERGRETTLQDRAPTRWSTFARRGGAASYRLLESHSRWDPCQVITYRVNRRLAPVGGVADVRRAFRMVSAASGLRFRYLGRTSHVPRRGGNTGFDPTADVSVAWARPTVVPVLAGSTIGYAGTQWQSTGGSWNRIVNGYVVLDTTWRGVPGFPLRKVQSRGQLLLHEIGHVVGLDHVNDRSQTLHPTLQRAPARFGAGDLAGLAEVGAGQGCF
ncbi:matrixin family metalloprotease [Nocardioides pacificus]